MSAEEIFRGQVSAPERDPSAAELRRILTHAKLEAIEQAASLSAAGLGLVIPGLHHQLAQTLNQLVERVGLGVAFALEAVDEQRSGASISVFKRELRDLMTSRAVELKRTASTGKSRRVAELLAQRLAWRHSHEFLSWLAFRRDDQAHDAEDRLARLDAFKVPERLLRSRAAVTRLLGGALAQAIEAHDRFSLAHRWPEPAGAEAQLEALNWRLLAYRDAPFVELELARARFDHCEASRAGERADLASMIEAQLIEQLGQALAHLPAHAR